MSELEAVGHPVTSRWALRVHLGAAALLLGTSSQAAASEVVTAVSQDGSLRVTLVHGSSWDGDTTSAGMLLQPRNGLATWVALPPETRPEAVAVLPSSNAVVLVERDARAKARVRTYDMAGQRVGSLSLADLMPGASLLGTDRIRVEPQASGPCLTVPLECGSLALVDLTAPRADAVHGVVYDACSIVLSPKRAVGVDVWMDQGRELMRSGDVEAARFALEAAVEADPSDARTYRELARFHRRIGDAQAQLACLQLGIERLHDGAGENLDSGWRIGSPEARLALEYVAATREVMGDEHAFSALDETLALYPCMEEAVLLRAELLIATGDDLMAIASLEAAIDRLGAHPELAHIHHDVGRFLKRQKRPRAAILFLEDAYALGDTSDFLLRSLGDLNVQLKEYEEAAKWLSLLAQRWRENRDGASSEERQELASERLSRLELEIASLFRNARDSD